MGVLVHAVLDPKSDIRFKPTTVLIQNLHPDQGRPWCNSLERFRFNFTVKMYRQPRAAYRDAGDVGTVTVVVLRVAIAVNKIPAGSCIDAVGVHEVVHVNPGIADADTHVRPIGVKTLPSDLALQSTNPRCALVELDEVGVVLVLLNAHYTRNLL
jgi:hypothetical protein